MKKLILSLLLLLSQVIFGQQTFSKVLKDTPGVVSFTFRNDFSKDVAGTLDYIKEVGIRNIEFSNLFGKTATEMRALLDARGMVCTSYGVYYDALTNKTDAVIQDAKILGAEFVRVGMIPHKGEFTVQQADAAIKDFNRVGKILKENAVDCFLNKDANILINYHVLIIAKLLTTPFTVNTIFFYRRAFPFRIKN